MKFEFIGDLMEHLAEVEDKTALVFIDNRHPTALSSYRGYYDQLAIERSGADHQVTEAEEPGKPFELNMAGYGTYTPGTPEVRIKQPPTVADVLEALRLADGTDFEGYKGGQFLMDRYTPVWVSEYGQADGLEITGMEVLPGRVDFVTTEKEGWF